MKSLTLAVIAAFATIATTAVAAPTNSNSFTGHGVFGGNDYGR